MSELKLRPPKNPSRYWFRLVHQKSGGADGYAHQTQHKSHSPEDAFAREQRDRADHQRGLKHHFPEIEAIGAAAFEYHFVLGFFRVRFDVLLLVAIARDFLGVLFLEFFDGIGILKREDGKLIEEKLVGVA